MPPRFCCLTQWLHPLAPFRGSWQSIVESTELLVYQVEFSYEIPAQS